MNENIGELGTIQDLDIGISWDLFDKDSAVDLDASCVFFDGLGMIIDAVFYNQLETGYAVHSGDNRTGEGEGFDETIRIKLSQMKEEIESFMIVINAHTGGNFVNVETATAALMNPRTNQTIYEISVGCEGPHTALIVCCVYRIGLKWMIKKIERVAEGKNFQEVEKEMKEELRFLVSKEMENGAAWDSNTKKTFNMKKGDVVRLKGLNTIKMCLGWDSKCDLDASVIELGYDLRVPSIVMYSQKSNENGSIRHSGDNRTGAGSGDDETISIDLDRVDPKVAMLMCIVNVFSGSFGDVKGAYCRLLNPNDIEVCRYNLSDQESGNAMMMCLLLRTEGSAHQKLWKIKALGEKTVGCTAQKSKQSVIEYLRDFQAYKDMFLGPTARIMLMRFYTEVLKKWEGMKSQLVEVVAKIDQLQMRMEEEPPTIEIMGKVKLECQARNVDKMDLFGKSDPYYIIKDQGLTIYRSEVVKVTLDPNWKSHTLEGIDDLQKTYLIEVYDWDKRSSDDLIGSFEFSFAEVLNGKVSYDIINQKKQSKKRKYKNSGVFTFATFEDKMYKENPEMEVLENKLKKSESDRKKFEFRFRKVNEELERVKKLFVFGEGN